MKIKIRENHDYTHPQGKLRASYRFSWWTFIHGYGDTVEEALEDFKRRWRKNHSKTETVVVEWNPVEDEITAESEEA